MTNTTKAAGLTNSTRKIQEAPPFITVDHLLAEYNQKDEQIAEAFPHYKNKLAAVMCAASKKLSHDDADSAKALLGLIDSGDSKVIKQLVERLRANLADTSHNNWEAMYLSVATFAHHVPSELLGHDDVYPLLVALSARLKGMLTSEPTLLLPAIYAVHLLILKVLAAGVTYIIEEKRTTIQSQLSAVRETVSELVKMTKEGEPPLSHYRTAMLTTIKTLLSSSEQLLDEDILKIESKRTKRIKCMKDSGRFVFQLARCATSWYGEVPSVALSTASSIASTWQCLNTGRQLMSPLIAQAKTYLIGPSQEARLIAFLHEWHQAESSVTRLDLLESDRTQASQDYSYLYGMVTLLRWIDDENDEEVLSSAIQARMVAYFDVINDKTMPEQQQLYDAILDWIASSVKGKPPYEWPTVFMRGAIPQAIKDYQPSDNTTAPSQHLDCLATAWYQQFPHDKTTQEASRQETVPSGRLTLLKKRLETSPEKQSPWGACCFAQLCARYDADNQQGSSVVATDEAIVALQQTLKNIGCTDYKNIPEEQLARLLTLDEVEHKRILQMMSQFVRDKIAASGKSEVSVGQYLKGVLNRTIHYTAVPEESMDSSSSGETVGRQQAAQISLTANSKRLNDVELLSHLPVTLSLPSVEVSHHARVNINVCIKDSFNISTSGTSFVLPELSVLTTHLVSLRETHLSQDDVNILLDIAKTCQQHHYAVHAVCLYALLYRAKEQNGHHDTHTLLFYQTQLTPLLSQPPCVSKQIAFQSAQGTFHQPVAIQESDTWFDVGLHFQQSSLLHYLLCHGELPQTFNKVSTGKETSDSRIVVTHETMLHRLCRSGIADVSLYQRCIKIWPQALVAQTVEGHLPVHQAACFANQDVFDYVTKKTTKATACVQMDSQGNSLLHLAAMYANTEVVNLLLPQGDVEVNARNADNGTPLHCAALGRQLEQGRTLSDYAAVFNSLLVQGADPMAVDNHQKNARDIIRLSGNVTLLTVFDKVLNCTAPERLWQYWQTAMISYYCKETFVNKRLFNDDYFSLVNYFVNLQVVKADKTNEVTQSNDDKCSHKPLRARDRLAGKKEAIAPGDLFQPSAYQDANGKSPASIDTVVVSGAAGVGKTTLLDYIAYQWALFKQGACKKGLWSDFETVLIVRCRDLQPKALGLSKKTKDIAELLSCACWGQLDIRLDEARQLLSTLKSAPESCLLLLDGLDELPVPKKAYWRNLLVQLFQLPCKKLVTTRPYAIGNLQQWLSHDGLVEIQGFSDEDVPTFFKKHLGATERTNNFIKDIKRNSDLWAIVHIPINAYLLKIWWETTCQQDKPVLLGEMSVSHLYESLMVNVCRRYLAKIGELDESKLLDDELVLEVPSIRCLLDTLGCWAFEGLRQDTAQLPISWLKGIQGSDESPTLLSTNRLKQLNMPALKALGLLKQVGHAIRAQQMYEFLHLSFQEFLAANVIAVTLRQNAKEKKTHLTQVIHRYKYHPNFILVWPSVAGLLSRCPTALNDFLSILVAGPKDWVGIVEADLLMRCLESSLSSSTDTKALGLRQQTLLRAVKRRINVKRFDELPLGLWTTINTLSLCPRLIRLSADMVCTFLRDETVGDSLRDKLARSVVAHLSQIPELVDMVWAFLRDETVRSSMRGELVKSAVSHLSQTPEFVDTVWAFLRDKTVNSYVRGELAKSAFAYLSQTPEFMNTVLAFLRDEMVRGSVRGELASSAVSYLSPSLELVDAVLAFLRDKTAESSVRGDVAKSAVSHLSPTPELVDAVLALLRDKAVRGSVRSELASNAVSHLSPTLELVDTVLAFLRDEMVDDYIRGELASSAVTHLSKAPKFVDAVLAFLRDETVRGSVRSELASNAVSHLSPTLELVDTVLAFLRDEMVDDYIRGELASSAVAHLSKAPKFVDAVLAFLRDETVDVYVRGKLASSAVAHLSKAPKFVDAVLAFLRDETVRDSVRSELASSAVAHLSKAPKFVDAVLAFLRDETVRDSVRSELASSVVAHLSPTPGFVDTVLAFLRDETVRDSVRSELASSVVAHLSPTPGFVDTVLAFLRDETVRDSVRRELASSAAAHLSQIPECVGAVLAFLRDEAVRDSVRGKLARGAVAHLSQIPEYMDAVLVFLRDEQLDVIVRGALAISAVEHLPQTPEFVDAVLMLLRDETVINYVRINLAISAVEHLPQTPEFVDAVLMLLRDETVIKYVRVNLAISAVEHLSPTPKCVDAVVWVLLRDETLSKHVRGVLATSTVAHLSQTPEFADAVWAFLRDETVSWHVRGVLATSIAQQLPKCSNKDQIFLDSLFAKDSVEYGLSQHADIPVHLLLPLYKKAHDKGRQYIREQLVKHDVLVYEQAGTVIVAQAGQTEQLTLSQSIIQQIKRDLQPYRMDINNSVSIRPKLSLFSKSVMSFFSSQHTENSSGQASHSNIRRVMQ